MLKKISYTLKVALPILGWAILCIFFFFTLIISTTQFGQSGNYSFFLKFVLTLSIVLVILVILRMSGLLGGGDIKTINKNIIDETLNPQISLEEAQKTFYYLVRFCRNNFSHLIWIGLPLTILVGSIMKVYKNISEADFLIILASGVVSMVLSAVFASLYSEYATFPVIKAIRKKIIQSNGKIPKINFDSIMSKFYFLFLFPIITMLVVLICVFPFGFNVVILSLIGTVMILIIDRVIFLYLTKSFFETQEFAQEMYQGKEEIFAIGSIDKEFVELMDNLNAAGEKVWSLKQESDLARKNMEEKVKELEKFFDLTINREIKMVELKKELKAAKQALKEFKNRKTKNKKNDKTNNKTKKL
ncbi:MAG TPA: hypothetical protein PL093_00365 [Candidatus Pacearchaeota archaeon]|nr:hypothetical protein [Candidatus Pacearchaeota archaeon]HRR94639.1 hypothetical protein [Candidatus Paceibacterota bacterium]HPC30345.1 hypothetical protein [Candidatus Pacearchaeota archaeon]HQG09035.1 hypothetical protein [Candidatus Pacearchaeota archaeon]HQH20016.1 hypothetical protein [Candidatus Pacearchaeota archaeon]